MIRKIVFFCCFMCSNIFLFAQKVEVKKLLGKWQWLETTGGFGGLAINPQTEKYQYIVEFGKSNVYREWKDGSPHLYCRYQLKKAKSVNVDGQGLLIYFTQGKRREEKALPVLFSFKGKDTLLLTDNVYDGYTKTFVRIKK
jgi:hypothetical protein